MIDVETFDWDDGFYGECDMNSEGRFESSFNERLFATLFTTLVVATLLFVIVSLGLSSCADKHEAQEATNDTELVTIYDTAKEDDSFLYEGRGLCSECGREGYTIDGNIVCRNEDCPNYGLAAPAIMPETENQ